MDQKKVRALAEELKLVMSSSEDKALFEKELRSVFEEAMFPSLEQLLRVLTGVLGMLSHKDSSDKFETSKVLPRIVNALSAEPSERLLRLIAEELRILSEPKYSLHDDGYKTQLKRIAIEIFPESPKSK